MASTPAFANTPRIGFGAVSAANTNFDGTGTIVDVLTGVAAGTRIERVRLQATVDPADCVVTMFLHDGTSYRFWRAVDLGNPPTGSTTVNPYGIEIPLTDMVLPSASWKFAAAITVALTSGVVNVFAFGADLT